jgi:hypothetical protein
MAHPRPVGPAALHRIESEGREDIILHELRLGSCVSLQTISMAVFLFVFFGHNKPCPMFPWPQPEPDRCSTNTMRLCPCRANQSRSAFRASAALSSCPAIVPVQASIKTLIETLCSPFKADYPRRLSLRGQPLPPRAFPHFIASSPKIKNTPNTWPGASARTKSKRMLYHPEVLCDIHTTCRARAG